MAFFKVEVRVGKSWVPAHRGVMSEVRAKKLKAAYNDNRPDADVRIIPEGSVVNA